MKRSKALSELVDILTSINLDHPVRVGVDGVDASGKTILADELALLIQFRGHDAIRVSVDDFHNPCKIRYQQGRTSPKGFYDDSFNYSALISHVLEPLGPEGDLKYNSIYFDLNTNSKTYTTWKRAEPEAILLLDGIFLHRSELRGYWDFSVFVHADFDIIIKRAQERDIELFGNAKQVREIYKMRYIPGQQIYLNTEFPFQRADILWDNNDFDNPSFTNMRFANKRL